MADFEAPSFSLGLDFEFEAPSFSLGFDFDTEPQQPAPFQSSFPKHPPQPTTLGNTEDFELKTLDPEPHTEDSPPVLNRLKRGPRNQSPVKAKSAKIDTSLEDDEIEEILSQEDQHRADGHLLQQNLSFSGTSKFSPQGYTTPNAELGAKLNAQQGISASNAPPYTSMESGNNRKVPPKLKVSPLSRFQLLDSDSEEPSTSSILSQDASGADSPPKERQCKITQPKVENLQQRKKVPLNMPRIDDMWKGFSSKKCVNIPTPALDEMCEEYFSSVKDNNVGPGKVGDVSISGSKGCYQTSCISEDVEFYGNRPNSLLPASKYFYHADPRIQRLVRERLPYFSPLDDHYNQSDAADIDYMCQFGQKDPTPSSTVATGSSRRSTKNGTNETPEVSACWVNPKSSTNIPKNAGKRRVSVGGRGGGRGGGRSAGNWYTGENGRKVFVTNTGQELTGHMAYRHYRKASGVGFKNKKSRKKAASKKKARR